MPFDIESYVQDNLTAARRTAPDNYQATCPFCSKALHFYINIENGRYICFKCDARGNGAAAIIAQVEGITIERAKAAMLRRAVQFRRKNTIEDLTVRIQALRPDVVREDDPLTDFDLPTGFVPVWKDGKWRMPLYLKERGIKKATAKAWGLGFCRLGAYGGRVVIPVICPNGRSFTARDTTDEQIPRYRNPKGADHGRLLCGWNVVEKAKAADVVLVEGPMDAIKMYQHGFPALALMGKELHKEQLALLTTRYSSDTAITIMLDPEEEVAPYKVGLRLLVNFEHVYVAKLPKMVGKKKIDPGNSTVAQATKALDEAKRYRGEMGAALAGRLAKSSKRLLEIYQR